MESAMMQLVLPLLPEARETLCRDASALLREGAATHVSFIFSLVPEGAPPFDKVTPLGERYNAFRPLLPADKPTGILLQSSMGHGWTPDTPAVFQRIVFADGAEPYMFCPLDPGLGDYLDDAARRVAELQPDFVMVDDDFRLVTGRGGCYCPLHLARYEQRHGGGHTRESLRQAVLDDPRAAEQFDALQRDSLLALAQRLRAAFDKVNPALPVSFCACADDMGHAPAIATALAAPGQRPVIRINNARYLCDSPRSFASWRYRTARQIGALSDDALILAEPDTFPHNRYATAAAVMHAQLALSLVEGCRGGKFWLARTGANEPESGAAYRETLSRHAPLYRALIALDARWEGPFIPLPEKEPTRYPPHRPGDGPHWSDLLGRMGFPFRFARAGDGGVALMTGADVEALGDDEVAALLDGALWLDGSAAIALTRRGFAERLGVRAEPLERRASFEKTADGGVIPIPHGARLAALQPLTDNAEQLSALHYRAYALDDNSAPVGPGCLRAGRAVVWAGVVAAEPLPSFLFLTQTRKAQLARLYAAFFPGLPYVGGDAECMTYAGRDAEGRRLVAVANLGLDAIASLPLAGVGGDGAALHRLSDAGTWETVAARREEGRLFAETRLPPLGVAMLAL